MRFKFSWDRGLGENEAISLYVTSAVDARQFFNWVMREDEIWAGGGAVHPIPDTPGAYRFEVNAGLGSLPAGEAYWKVAIYENTPSGGQQLTEWSEERLIVGE